MSKFSRWLDEVQDEEAGFGGDDDGEELGFLPAWARNAVGNIDAGLDKADEYLATQQEKWTPPWLTSDNVRESAQVRGARPPVRRRARARAASAASPAT